MKRTWFLLAAIVMITACQSSQNPNANLNSNTSGQSGSVEVTDEEKCSESNDYYKREIIINPGLRIPSINDIPISLLNGPKKVNWCVRNNAHEPINVVIAHLHEIRSPFRSHPFGNELPNQNAFITLTINPGRVKNVITEDAKKGGTYEYDVLLFDKNGKPADFVDPQVVISDGRRTVDRPANSNTVVRNANTSNKKKK
jgi:hypothetical protein